MTNKELFTGLMGLHFRLGLAEKTDEARLVREAASVILEYSRYEMKKSEPEVQTSNGDPIATFFNNVVSIQKAAK